MELFTSPAIFDITGSRIGAFYSHFETLGPQASAAQAVSFSASANAIDVRFSGPVPGNASQAYLRQGMTLIPSELVAAGVDQIRVIPTSRWMLAWSTTWFSMHLRSWPSRWKRSLTLGWRDHGDTDAWRDPHEVQSADEPVDGAAGRHQIVGTGRCDGGIHHANQCRPHGDVAVALNVGGATHGCNRWRGIARGASI